MVNIAHFTELVGAKEFPHDPRPFHSIIGNVGCYNDTDLPTKPITASKYIIITVIFEVMLSIFFCITRYRVYITYKSWYCGNCSSCSYCTVNNRCNTGDNFLIMVSST